MRTTALRKARSNMAAQQDAMKMPDSGTLRDSVDQADNVGPAEKASPVIPDNAHQDDHGRRRDANVWERLLDILFKALTMPHA